MNTILMALLLAVSSQTAKHLDAENVEQAFGMISADAASKEVMRRKCGSWLPHAKAVIDTQFYLWRDANEKEIFAAERYRARQQSEEFEAMMAALPDQLESQLSALTEPQREAVCSGMLFQIDSGEQNIATRTPNASKFALADLEREPQTKPEMERANFIAGCVKQGLNAGGNYDVLNPYCLCLEQVIESSLTSAEKQQMTESARSGDRELMTQLMMERQDEIVACVTSKSAAR